MLAHIGVMRALNRHVERVFDPSRKDHRWGRRKLARDRCLVPCPQMPHRKFNLTVWQLPPLLNNCHVTALRKLVENLTSLEASRFDRQSERLSRNSVIRLAAARYPVGKIARSVVRMQGVEECRVIGREPKPRKIVFLVRDLLNATYRK